ncbi:unnamed protein product [Moneuplotes crassus]|uniref:Uncharacterized protein n=1 Tax=Euplotes crassus TaxID=5936 RepID=A0AAD1U6A2_EUPCR|nr:unnamed protein product [Moneuplotes crassus]
MNRDIDCFRELNHSNRSNKLSSSNISSFRSNKLIGHDFENVSSDRFKVKPAQTLKPLQIPPTPPTAPTPLTISSSKASKIPLKLSNTHFQFEGQKITILRSLKSLISQQKGIKSINVRYKAVQKLKQSKNPMKYTSICSNSTPKLPKPCISKLKILNPSPQFPRNPTPSTKKTDQKRFTIKAASYKSLHSSLSKLKKPKGFLNKTFKGCLKIKSTKFKAHKKPLVTSHKELRCGWTSKIKCRQSETSKRDF